MKRYIKSTSSIIRDASPDDRRYYLFKIMDAIGLQHYQGYEGSEFSEVVDAPLAYQVIPMSQGRYQLRIFLMLDDLNNNDIEISDESRQCSNLIRSLIEDCIHTNHMPYAHIKRWSDKDLKPFAYPDKVVTRCIKVMDIPANIKS